jgi:uncharacterized protein
MDASVTKGPGLLPSLLRRRSAIRIMLAGAIGSGVNAYCIEPNRLAVTRREIRCPRLPAALDGLRVGLLADVHFKPDRDAELLDEAVTALNAEKPDLIALPGDFVDNDHAVLAPMLETLRRLHAPHGVFASMGNHDGWSMESARMRPRFEKAGISFLVNRHTRLTVGNEPLAIAATDYVWRGNPDPAKTLRGIPAQTPVIALVHEPDFFDEMLRHRPIALQLSGHTHGGQCRVPLIGYAPAKVAFGQKYIYGEVARGDSRLFVTRGLGTSTLRVRFACLPEVAILTLRSRERA